MFSGPNVTIFQAWSSCEPVSLWGFCRNWFLMSPLHCLTSPSDFGFEFAEIFVYKKQLPAIIDTGSRLLRVSVIQGVANSPHHWYAESPTPRITDTPSRQLPASLIRGVGDTPHHRYGESAIKFFKINRWYRESSTSRPSDRMSRRRLYRWVGKSPTLRISIQRVADSAYHRHRELTTPRIVESASWRLRGLVIRGVAIQRKY